MEKILATVAGATMGILAIIFLLMGIVGSMFFPEQAQVIGLAFVIIGAAFVLMTLVFLRMASRYRRQKRQIMADGRKIDAEILEVKEVTEITINGKHPYVVICTAEGRTFESDYFYEDVHRFDDRKMIDVYLSDKTSEVLIDLES
ncbi:MAG: hypothetical protein IKV65_04120 [Erysipelotrichaceae bacterium]|nr:hypothetical protein [Erysipelotrichaceae bacterium]